jgi:hypothetical protein
MERRKRYPVIDGMKLCSKCNTVKPITEYSPAKNAKGESIYRYHCKECMRVYYTNSRRSKGVQASKHYPIIDGHKECTRCSQVKPVIEFRKMTRNISGIRSHCIQCDLERTLAYRRAKGKLPNTFVAHPVVDGVKKCHVCLKNLSVDNFYVNKKGYMKHSCKKCNIELQRPYRNQYYKRDSEQLTDGYIGMVLRKHVNLHLKDIPKDLIDITRKKIKLQRELKQLKQSI